MRWATARRRNIRGRTYTALMLLLCAPKLGAAQQPQRMTWKVDGLEREGLVYAPASRPANVKSPVVLVFHGHGGVMRNFANNSRFFAAWPEAIVVYLQGLPIVSAVDPTGVRSGWDSGPDALKGKTNRDLDLVDSVLATLHRNYAVDETRIYAAGFSNGAIFSLLLWAARGSVFAAVGPVAGVMRGWQASIPRSVIYIAGTKDPLVTPALQRETLALIHKIDGVTGDGTPCGAGCLLYASAMDAPLKTMTHEGAHVYPPFATDAIVAFFKEHSLNQK